mmetsp:Transcript_26122/g.46447  ORF Transcript_26122/g.46447 Transcript_26122/m.46447 type:complete len:529 (+) Transcript_26122:2930-4516(+)
MSSRWEIRQTKYLNGEFTIDDLKAAIRRLVRNISAFPVFCGSALKNRGVQALMDGVIDYLPSPSDSRLPIAVDEIGRKRPVETTDKELRALAFKYIYEQGRQPLTYVRIYSGKLKNGATLLNTSQGITDKPSRIYRVQAGQYVELNEVGPGDIAGLAGLKHTRSGDTLVLKGDKTGEVLPGLQMPPPVFFCSIDVINEIDKEKLEETLNQLIKEDPSLMIRVDDESKSILVTGQGELHLEILRDRLAQNFGLKTALGPMQVAYRESARKPVRLTYRLDRNDAFIELTMELRLRESDLVLDSVSQVMGSESFKSLHASASLDLIHIRKSSHTQLLEKAKEAKTVRSQVRAEGGTLAKSQLEIEAETLLPIHKINPDTLKVILAELVEGLNRGPLIGYPVIEVEVCVLDGLFCKSRTTQSAIREAIASGLQELLSKADPYLLEPMMKVRIKVNDSMISDIVSDMTTSRRAEIVEVQREDGFSTLIANAPLSELVGYSSVLRSLTRGTGEFSMEYASYAYVGDLAQQQLLL